MPPSNPYSAPPNEAGDTRTASASDAAAPALFVSELRKPLGRVLLWLLCDVGLTGLMAVLYGFAVTLMGIEMIEDQGTFYSAAIRATSFVCAATWLACAGALTYHAARIVSFLQYSTRAAFHAWMRSETILWRVIALSMTALFIIDLLTALFDLD